jgi:hypothetical protein
MLAAPSGLNNIAAGPTAGSISQVYATGAVTGTGASPSAVGGWSATTATPSRNPTGIVTRRGRLPASARRFGRRDGGDQRPAQSAAANYAFKQSAYGSFSFPGTGSTGWFMVDGQTRPFGRWEYQTTITNATSCS